MHAESLSPGTPCGGNRLQTLSLNPIKSISRPIKISTEWKPEQPSPSARSISRFSRSHSPQSSCLSPAMNVSRAGRPASSPLESRPLLPTLSERAESAGAGLANHQLSPTPPPTGRHVSLPRVAGAQGEIEGGIAAASPTNRACQFNEYEKTLLLTALKKPAAFCDLSDAQVLDLCVCWALGDMLI